MSNLSDLRLGACAAVIGVSVVLGACTTTSLAPAAGSSQPAAPWSGVVQSINETQSTGSWQSMTGGITGSIAGVLVGSRFGGGVGKTILAVVSSAVGSVGGSKVGSALGTSTAWDVTVRGNDGIDKTVRVAQRPTYGPGTSVQVGTDGTITAK
jgi:outer membrane lipoprotein SlyB